MSFCPRCGRRRGPDARFCGGCGHAFGQQAAGGGTAPDAGPAAGDPPAADSPAAAATRVDPAPAAEPAEPGPFKPAALKPGEPTRWDAPAGPTRFDAPAWPTRADPALDAAHPGRYASRNAGPSPAGGAAPPPDAPAAPGKADQWEAGDTVFAEPPAGGGYPPPASPAYPPPPGPVVPGRRPGNRRTAAFIIAVVLVALAAGGGAYALAGSQRHSTAPPPGTPATGSGSAAPSDQGPASPTAGASASPAVSPSASVTPAPARTGTVRAAAGIASHAAAPRVLAYLNRYFSAINSRNYDAYQSLLDAREQAGNSRSTFDSGYATTRDSNEVLTGIEETGGGRLTADVSFTSHQSPANSVDGSACNNWQISLYLVPAGTSYVMTAAPAGYHAGYTDC